eukprot:TRINITY_DN19687_c0_g1_i1.p1 TRINITY_DN19687_c0_g1~~TRINITY_DN19687_c0_g1_i1.p1  ORF type:complete len:1160 (+),score=119.44 TRINITY_DN19687_c0_g1_i1:78-3557(+)
MPISTPKTPQLGAHKSAALRVATRPAIYSDAMRFTLNRRFLYFTEPSFEQEFMNSRKSWLRKLSLYLGPFILLINVIYFILSFAQPDDLYPKWYIAFRALAVFSVVLHMAFVLAKRTETTYIYMGLLLILAINSVIPLVGIAVRQAPAAQQELYLSLAVMAGFVLRVFMFRHVVFMGFFQASGYGLLWLINRGFSSKSCLPAGCFMQTEYVLYFFGIGLVLCVNCYSFERNQREAFALSHKTEQLASLIASMDLETCDELMQIEQQPGGNLGNASSTEHYLWTIVARLKMFRAYLPQALRRHTQATEAISTEERRGSYGVMIHSQDDLTNDVDSNPGSDVGQQIVRSHSYAILDLQFGLRDVSVLVAHLPYARPLPSSMQVPNSVPDLRSLFKIDELFVGCALEVLEECSGVVLSFGGGNLVATWNAHRPTHMHAYWACRCALLLQTRLTEKLLDLGPETVLLGGLQMAVATGPCVVGSIGSAQTQSPVVMGAVMEMALHLTHLNPHLETSILISQDTYEAAESSVKAVIVDYVHPFRGYEQDFTASRVAVYELISMRGALASTQMVPDLPYKEAFVDFAAQRYAAAETKLSTFLTQFTGGTNQSPPQGMPWHMMRQALRLWRMATLFRLNDTLAPTPYFREHGWQQWNASVVPLPPQFNSLAQSVREGSASFDPAQQGLRKRQTMLIRERLTQSQQTPKHATSTTPKHSAPTPKKIDYHSYLMRTHSSEAVATQARADPVALGEQLFDQPRRSTSSSSSSSDDLMKQVGLPNTVNTPSPSAPFKSPPIKSLLRTNASETDSDYNRTISLERLQAQAKGVVAATRVSVHSRHSLPTVPPPVLGGPQSPPTLTVQSPNAPATTNHTAFLAPPRSPAVMSATTSQGSTQSDISQTGVGLRNFQDCDGNAWQVSDILLGRGAFGSVFLGMSDSGTLAAIKCMSVSISVKQQEELLNEVRLLSTFQHDNIVAYLGSAVVGHNLLVIMQYISCGTLAYIVRHFGKLEPASVVQYSRHILRGLAYLHSHDVVHRDIKPPNVLLDESGRCKLTDFGTADRFNAMGTVKGTPMYMAPESLMARACKASDIWSFGLTVLELLTGSLPWNFPGATNPHFLINLILSPDTQPQIPSWLPIPAQQFILQCVQRDEASRPSADQLLEHAFLL